MELNKLIFPLRKWWWLVLASTLVAAIFSLFSVLRQPTIYESRTTLLIGTMINDPNPGNNEFILGQQLASSYANLANREIVRTATKNALNIDRLPEYIAREIPNTQLIEIVVSDVDPERAQIVANELATQLVLLSPTSPGPEEQARQEFINQQMSNIEVQIQETEAEIERLQQELGTLISAQQILETQDQIFALQSKLNTMQDEYGDLLANTQQGAINTLTVIEYATRASNPVGPRKGLTILLAAVIGFVLAACEAYLLEYLDDSLKLAGDVERMFGVPIIGHVFEQEMGKTDEDRLHAADELRHPIAESFRSLRTNLEITQGNRPLKTILVTSADIGDGKTSVAANLALSMAQRDKKVVLVDVDLRRPSAHEFFQLPNQKGLVDLIADGAVVSDVLQTQKDRKVSVLTSGGIPPNPTEILSSEKMDQLLCKLKDTTDVVIIDGPPFIVPDATVMASKVDGVLLVVRPGHTRRSLAQGAAEQLKRAGASTVGVVLNRIPLRNADYYAGRGHVYAYYSGYGDERSGRERGMDDLEKLPEKLWEFLSPYVSRAGNSIKHFFENVFKLSPK